MCDVSSDNVYEGEMCDVSVICLSLMVRCVMYRVIIMSVSEGQVCDVSGDMSISEG